MSFIQNLFTSRDNGANAETYVGQEGRLWWDPLTNSLYYSDGSTPGGIPVGAGGNPFNQLLNTYNDVQFNNVTVAGNLFTSNTATVDLGNIRITDQTITGIVPGRDLTLATSDAGANLEMLGPFHIHSDGNSANLPNFIVKADGQIQTFVATPDSNQGAVAIIGTTSRSYVPAGNPGGMLHVTGQNGLPSRIYNDGVSNYPLYVGRRYNGTALAPTGVLAGQIISRIGANPYLNDDANFTALGTAQINFVATEIQTTTNQGSKIVLSTTLTGTNTQANVATFDTAGILLTGNVIPSVNNTYELGNSSRKWANLYLGPDSLFIEDAVLGTDAQVTVSDGTLLINGVSNIQVGNMQMTTTGVSLIPEASSQNIIVGRITDTGYMQVNMAGIQFKDSTRQTTAAIPLSYLANAYGVATLGADSKVLPEQLPAGAVFFKGTWNAATNTPALADGSGTAGWEYQCTVPGTVNFGSGPIAFLVGDFVIYNGTVWQRIPGSGAGVSSFNTRTGAVTLSNSDVIGALSPASITNSLLASNSITITTSTGLSGGGTVTLGNTLTLLNTGVTSITGGTGVSASGSTGGVTLSIGQPVGTANSVQFAAVSATTTIQATGNITGGNLTTGGRVVATGNIETTGYVKTSGTFINSGISSTGNANVGNIGATFGVFSNVSGNGANLSSITGSNVTGQVGFAAVANSVAGANVSGQVGNALVAGTVYTNAQPNITSVGTLTGLSSAGTVNFTAAGNVSLGANSNVHISGGSANYALVTNGSGALSWANISGIDGYTAQTVSSWVPTLTATGGGTFTYNVQTGYYIKSGRSVTCYFTISITGVTGVSGIVEVSNLPVTSINQTNAGGGALDNYSFAALPSHVTGLVLANSTTMSLYWHDRTGSTNSIGLMTTGNLGTTATLIGRITYISAT